MARSVTDKTSDLGRAGQFAAMAEILARGWNVAIPEVDTGDDVFVAQDDGARLTRVQLKTTVAVPGDACWRANSIALPSRQLLREDEEVPLTYAFAVRIDRRWEFVVVARDVLRGLWRTFQSERLAAMAEGRRLRGRPLKGDAAMPAIAFVFSERDVTAWGGRSFQAWRNNWEAFELLMQPGEEPTEPGPSSSRAPRSGGGPAGDPDSSPSGGE
jgi:hypothetical protein